MEHIEKHAMTYLKYNMKIFKRDITIFFLTEKVPNEQLTNQYNKYVTFMLYWLYMIHKDSSNKCSLKLNVFIYHISLLKRLPKTNDEIIGQNNVNTAFTRTCPIDSEIVIFRKEEWFKVFIHESFHNFGLDFSGMDINKHTQDILNIFPVDSVVNLFEAYTECWARLINSLFCSFINMKDINDKNEFLENADFLIKFEIMFGFFQMVKILDFMGLDYQDLYSKTILSTKKRQDKYREGSNVLSYYVITLILLMNYQDFLKICNKAHGKNIFNFKKTYDNLDILCKFIENKHNTKNMTKITYCTKSLLHDIKGKGNKQLDYVELGENLRMTICEMD